MVFINQNITNVSKEGPNLDREAERRKAKEIYKNREEYRRQGQTENTNSDHIREDSKEKKREDAQAPNLNKGKDNEQDLDEKGSEK